MACRQSRRVGSAGNDRRLRRLGLTLPWNPIPACGNRTRHRENHGCQTWPCATGPLRTSRTKRRSPGVLRCCGHVRPNTSECRESRWYRSNSVLRTLHAGCVTSHSIGAEDPLAAATVVSIYRNAVSTRQVQGNSQVVSDIGARSDARALRFASRSIALVVN